MSTIKSEETVRLFAYGTLRKGGVAAHLLKEYPLIAQAVPLKGFALYDAGWYPFAVRSKEDSHIIGDIFEVPETSLPELDKYEGPEYERVFLEEQQLLIYLKLDPDTDGLLPVKEGDWLVYWKAKNM